MKKQLLAGAAALVIAAGMTTSAMAFSQGGRGHAGSFRAGGMGSVHSYGAVQGNRFAGTRSFGGNRFAGVRGFNSFRDRGFRGQRFVGGGWGYPYDAYAADVGLVGLGIGLAGVATGYCDPYSYGWGYGGYCGYGYGTPIDAWSW